ncbi:MAG: hypothetical protein HY804_13225 [Nitrospinae bacterium]|nr:hypothetical protein [Nitrospinota bacterium]
MKRAVGARQSFFTLTEYAVRMILADFWLLEKTRIRLWRNSFLRFNRAQGAKLAVAAALGALFAAGDYWFFHRILTYFNTLPVDVGEILVIQMLNLLCLTFFSMLVFSNVITSISTMFLSRDLDLLVSSPIPTRQLFLSRYVGTLINSSWMAALFMIPALCAFGEVAYAPYGYYALMLALLPPFLLIPACAGTLVTMLLMRYFPARRAHQILSFVGMIFIAGLVMVIRFMEPEKYLGRKVSDEAIIGFVESLKAPDYPWLPSSMTARALQLASVDDFAGAFWPAAVLWFIAVAALAFVVAVAGGVYYRGWSAAYGSERTMMSRRRGGLFYRLLGALLSRAGHDTRALAMKDMKIFWRDTGQWSQLFMLGALVVVYLFNIRNLPLTTMALNMGEVFLFSCAAVAAGGNPGGCLQPAPGRGRLRHGRLGGRRGAADHRAYGPGGGHGRHVPQIRLREHRRGGRHHGGGDLHDHRAGVRGSHRDAVRPPGVCPPVLHVHRGGHRRAGGVRILRGDCGYHPPLHFHPVAKRRPGAGAN